MIDSFGGLDASINVVNQAASEIDDLLSAAYGNMVTPELKQVRDTLVNVYSTERLASLPYKLAGHSISEQEMKMRGFFQNVFKRVPKDKIKRPLLNVIAGVVDNAKYVLDQNELREMYENLLANAMTDDVAEKCHPSFTTVISQLNPLEAQLLQGPVWFVQFKSSDSSDYKYYLNLHNEPNYEAITISIINLIRLDLFRLGLHTPIISKNNFMQIMKTFKCNSESVLFDTVVNSFSCYSFRYEDLNLCKVCRDKDYSFDTRSNAFFKHHQGNIFYGYYSLTTYGQAFTNICLSQNNNSRLRIK